MKITFFFLLTVLSSFNSANAENLSDLSRCTGVLQLAGITAKMSLENAPPYAREKYQKQMQFFMQGGNNLERFAKKLPDYSERAFSDASQKVMMQLLEKIKNQQLDPNQFNAMIFQCIADAGLNAKDYPQ